MKSSRVTTSYGFHAYRRSGNFRVKYTSPFNFSRCFIFVARAHRRKIKPRQKFLFTRTRARSQSRDRIPCRAIGEKLEPRISASRGKCSRHPCRITGREGTAIGYLPQKTSPVCLGPAVPTAFRSSLSRSRAWAGIEELSDLPGSGNTIDRFSGSAAETMLVLKLRFTKTHTLNRIINYSALKIFCVFNFCRNAISTKN